MGLSLGYRRIGDIPMGFWGMVLHGHYGWVVLMGDICPYCSFWTCIFVDEFLGWI